MIYYIITNVGKLECFYCSMVYSNCTSKVKFIVPQDKITVAHNNKNNSGVSLFTGRTGFADTNTR